MKGTSPLPVAALRDDDFITSTHRGHGHAHAHGDKAARSPEAKQEHYNKMMAEVMGKSGGYCKGKGGSMHIADVDHGNLGATGIVGGNLPVAVGAGLAQKLMGTDRVVVCFFGDGAANEGTFHESLNMASAFDLPVIFGNNQVAVFAAVRVAGTILTILAVGFVDKRVDSTSPLAIGRAVLIVTGGISVAMLGFALSPLLLLSLCLYLVIDVLRDIRNPLQTVWVNHKLDSRVRATVHSMFGQVDGGSASPESREGPAADPAAERAAARERPRLAWVEWPCLSCCLTLLIQYQTRTPTVKSPSPSSPTA